MSNDYFNSSSVGSAHTLARSGTLQPIIDAVAAGFAKLPGLAYIKQDRVTYVSTGGVADVYTVASTFPITSYTEGFHCRVKFHATNTGPTTINFDTLGAIAIKRPDGTDVEAGDLPSDGVVDLTFNGSEFRMNASVSVAIASTANLADNAVTTVKILDLSVTTAKLAADAVTTAKIASTALKVVGGLTPAANKMVYFTGSASGALADLTSFGRSLIGAANASAARTLLGLAALATKATVGTTEIDDDAVTLAKLAHGTQGGLLYFAGSGVPTELAAGTAGQVLQTQGAGENPLWADAAGGVALLATADASGNTEVDFDSNIDDTYDAYLIKANSVQLSVDARKLYARLKVSGSFQSSGYRWAYGLFGDAGGTPSGDGSTSASEIPLSGNDLGADAGQYSAFDIWIEDPSNSSAKCVIDFEQRGYQSSGDRLQKNVGTGSYDTAGAVTGIRFLDVAGATITGHFALYGIKRS